jgi:hypothetical protein
VYSRIRVGQASTPWTEMCRLLAREYSSIPGIDALMLAYAYGTYDRVKLLIIVGWICTTRRR